MGNSLAKLVLGLLGVAVCLGAQAQSTDDYLDFNAAYVQYSNTVNSNRDIARQAARRAFELGTELFGEDNERSAMLAINYANLLDDEAQVQRLLDAAVGIYQNMYGFNDPRLINPLQQLALSLAEADKQHLAAEYYLRALQLAVSHHGAESAAAAAIQLELGWMALSESRYEQGYSYLDAARSTLQQLDGPAVRSNLVRANQLLGDYYLRLQRYQEAVLVLLTALESLQAYPNADITVTTRIALIRAYERQGLSRQATEHCLAIGALRHSRPGALLRPLYTVTPTVVTNAAGGGENRTRIGFTVDAEGHVQEPRLLDPVASPLIEQALLSSVLQFRYAPRFESGIAVASPGQQFTFIY